MADYNLKDRQDLPVWNALEANNVKQALKLIDKRLAKKRTDRLEALKTYVRSRSPLLAEKSAVLLLIEELVERKTSLTDLEDIDLYDEALENVLPKPGGSWAKLIGELRWQSVKALSKNEELGLKCFQACLTHDDWEHGQQIASSLEKNFPNQHKYIFWNIASLFQRSLSMDVVGTDKASLWGRLAFGQIGKLATATRQAEGKSLPVRAIHTAQELLLLQKIGAYHGPVEDRLQYLQDPHLGPQSTVAKGDWELWRQHLQLLAGMQRWDELFSLTSSLLEKARSKDDSGQIVEARMADWIVWDSYLTSAASSQRSRWTDEALCEVAAHLDAASGIDKAWRRNASLAWLRTIFADASTGFRLTGPKHDTSEGVGENCGKVAAVIQYFEKFGDATTAYADIRVYAERLDIAERKMLLKILKCVPDDRNTTLNSKELEVVSFLGQNLNTLSGIIRRVNAYKVAYLLLSSLAEQERSACPLKQGNDMIFICYFCLKPCPRYCTSCLDSLAHDSIASYKSAIDDDGQISKSLLSTDRHPAEDFATIAAMCLVKLTKVKRNQAATSIAETNVARLLEAIVLLEHASARSTANFQISLLLIRLYAFIGCGSLAMKTYEHLGIKQIQQDTLSYTLFDRISSLHPHEFPQREGIVSKMRSPIDYFHKQHKLYKSARKQVAQNRWLAFEHGSYNSIFELKEFSDTISHTLSAATSVIECQRLARITMQKVNNAYDILPPDPELLEDFPDTNDYETFPNFESSSAPRFEQVCRFAPGPSHTRCRLNLITESLLRLLNPASTSEAHNSAELLRFKQQLHPLYKMLLQRLKFGDNAELTQPERSAAEAYDLIADILFDTQDTELNSDPDSIDDLVKANGLLGERLQEQMELVNGDQDTTPAFWGTLHSLYTAWQLSHAVLNLAKTLANSQKNLHESQVAANKRLSEHASKLLKAAEAKAKAVKARMDESGWIDKVIDAVLQNDKSGKPELAGEHASSVVRPLRGLIDESFLEEWAGNVVESWRDSVGGLSYIKST